MDKGEIDGNQASNVCGEPNVADHHEKRVSAPRHVNFVWTNDNEKILTEMWLSYSSNEIAKEIGTSRNSVIGKARRLHLQAKIAGATVAPSKTKPSRQRRPAPPPKPKVERVNGVVAPFKVSTVVALHAPETINVSIQDLCSHHCRWPTLDDASGLTIGFCGADSIDGRPYCAYHAKIAFTAPRPKSDQKPVYRNLTKG